MQRLLLGAGVAAVVCFMLAGCASNEATIVFEPRASLAQYKVVELADVVPVVIEMSSELVESTRTRIQEELDGAGLSIRPDTPPGAILVMRASVGTAFKRGHGTQCRIDAILSDKTTNETKGNVSTLQEGYLSVDFSRTAACKLAADAVVSAIQARMSARR